MPDQPSDHMPVTEESAAAFNRLRRLQEHSRSNIPALIAQRAASTFTLHDEPVPVEATDRVLVIVYPQDPFVGEPEVRTMSALDINSGLVNSRVRVQDNRGELAQPNADGNYMYWPGTPQFDQVNSFYYTTFSLRMFERFARRALPWSFPSPRITIVPYVGDQGTAFYSEQDRLLGFHSFALNGERVSTAWSADIVSHEAAHAVLDGLRDLYNESFGLGPTAFHESFGDMAAMLVALHDDSLVRRLLEWTKGDLRLDNFVASVAEQLTNMLRNDEAGYLRGHTVYLRNAINGFQKIPFDSLLYAPTDPEVELGRQSHNYSRLFTGAFYDILVGIYEFLNDTPNHIAIYRARNIVAYLLVCAVELGPVGEFTFGDMARAFLAADHVLYNGRFEHILSDVFERRGLLPKEDGRSFLQGIQNLPEVYLPKTINSALASALFLEQEIIPALNIAPDAELIPMAAYRNAPGYAYLTYFTSQRVTLNGANFGQYNGVSVDLFGGLTLMFGSDNRLRSAIYRPVLEEDIRQVKVLIAELVQYGLITDRTYGSFFFPNKLAPQGLIIPEAGSSERSDGESGRLVKFPVTVDRIPTPVTDFIDYLRKMKSKTGIGKDKG